MRAAADHAVESVGPSERWHRFASWHRLEAFFSGSACRFGIRGVPRILLLIIHLALRSDGDIGQVSPAIDDEAAAKLASVCRSSDLPVGADCLMGPFHVPPRRLIDALEHAVQQAAPAAVAGKRGLRGLHGSLSRKRVPHPQETQRSCDARAAVRIEYVRLRPIESAGESLELVCGRPSCNVPVVNGVVT